MDDILQKNKLRRKHQLGFLLNDLELQAFNKYCVQYKIKNRSKFIRETVVIAILEKFDEDYPSLFPKEE